MFLMFMNCIKIQLDELYCYHYIVLFMSDISLFMEINGKRRY